MGLQAALKRSIVSNSDGVWAELGCSLTGNVSCIGRARTTYVHLSSGNLGLNAEVSAR